jgi:hypothetical protein
MSQPLISGGGGGGGGGVEGQRRVESSSGQFTTGQLLSSPSPPSDGLDSLAGSPSPFPSSPTNSSEDHSLSFRVMRLARPEFKPNFSTLKCELMADGGDGEKNQSRTDWSSQVQVGHPSTACDLHGSLVLPQNFGSIQLGETFSCYISLGNVSSKPVSNISIRVELQTERQRRNIFENTSKPLETLAPGQRYDFIIQHDVKELGTHTLVCSTVYTEKDPNKDGSALAFSNQAAMQANLAAALGEGGKDPLQTAQPQQQPQQGERKYLPQWYKFKVTNPLNVRMKVRTVNNQLCQRTFVEACLENATGEPLFLDVVKFEQTKDYKLMDLDAGPSNSNKGKVVLESPSKVNDYLSHLVLLKPKGGSYNFIFGLEKCTSQGEVNSSSSSSSSNSQQQQEQQVEKNSNSLGKLEIKWCKPMGDSGRLQTQKIQGIASQNKRSMVEAEVTSVEHSSNENFQSPPTPSLLPSLLDGLPPRAAAATTTTSSSVSVSRGGIPLHSCFTVKMRVKNLTDKSLFGVFVVLGVSDVMRIVGPGGMYFKEIPSFSSNSSSLIQTDKHMEVSFDLIALQVGVHKLGPVLLYDERGKKVAEVTLDYSVEIVRQPQQQQQQQQQGHAVAQAEGLSRKDTLSTSMLGGSGTFDTLDSLIQI